MEKTTIWILLALIAFVLLRDKLFASGGVSGGFAAGTTGGTYGPSPSGNTYANTPPGTVAPKRGIWDTIQSGIEAAGHAYDTYEANH